LDLYFVSNNLVSVARPLFSHLSCGAAGFTQLSLRGRRRLLT